MIGRRPEPVPGVEPGRWRVLRARGLSKSERAWWYVDREGCYGSMCFHTWREAQDYADRMARTREYVLPRPDKDGYITTTDEQIAWENTEFERTVVSVAWIEEPGTIGLSTGDSDHYMTTDGAHSIALALAALAEQDKQCEK